MAVFGWYEENIVYAKNTVHVAVLREKNTVTAKKNIPNKLASCSAKH